MKASSSPMILLTLVLVVVVSTTQIPLVSSFLVAPTTVRASMFSRFHYNDDASRSWKNPPFITRTKHVTTTTTTTTSTTTSVTTSLATNKREADEADDGIDHRPRRRNDVSMAFSFPAVLTNLLWPPMSISACTIKLVLGHVLGGLVGLPFVAGAIPTWYQKIDLPEWTPPNRIFGPVWTVLYASMGYALSLVLAQLSSTTTTKATVGLLSRNKILALWSLHFGLNLAWAPVFFGLQRLRLGLIISYAMVFTLLAVMMVYCSIVPKAAFVLVPYLFWITFATALNQEICRRNPLCENGTNKAMRLAQLEKLQKKQKSMDE